MSLEFLSVIDPRVFCVDMEWLGDLARPSATYIYSIAAIHCATGDSFCRTIDPGVSARKLKSFHVYENCRKVTKSWLKRQNAVAFTAAFRELCAFVQDHSCVSVAPYVVAGASVATQSTAATNKQLLPPIIVAHGCQKADKPVLVSAIRRTGGSFPRHWRWFDSLYFFRRVMPSFRGGGHNGYSLRDVAGTVGVDCESFGRQHDAYPDAKTLFETLKTFPHLFGSLYGWHETALTNVPGVGLRTESALIQHNIRCVEHLLTFAAQCGNRMAVQGSSLRRPYALAHEAAPPPPVVCRERLEQSVARRLQELGVGRAARIAKWCVEAMTIFDEKN
jgi:hypothetical protein